MKSPILILLVAAFALFATSCDELADGVCENGEGPIETVTLNVPSFDAITLSNSADVVVTQGPDQSVSVSGEQNIIDLIDTDVQDGVWKIRFTKCVRNMDDMTIYITVPELTAVKIDGAGDITGDGTFSTDKFVAEINGAGDIDMEVDADEITADIDGAGDIKMTLTTKRLFSTIRGAGDLEFDGYTTLHDISLRGAGDVFGYDLESSEAVVSVAGAGDVKVSVVDKLDININGAGNVYYKGTPSLNIRIEGAGEVIDAN
ncbi:MAG: head GIN domain-containing protein [Bacteroidia bacterium]